MPAMHALCEFLCICISTNKMMTVMMRQRRRICDASMAHLSSVVCQGYIVAKRCKI